MGNQKTRDICDDCEGLKTGYDPISCRVTKVVHCPFVYELDCSYCVLKKNLRECFES